MSYNYNALYTAVREKLGDPMLSVRRAGETVEVFGFPPLTELSGRTYPCWHFAGKVTDFIGPEAEAPQWWRDMKDAQAMATHMTGGPV